MELERRGWGDGGGWGPWGHCAILALQGDRRLAAARSSPGWLACQRLACLPQRLLAVKVITMKTL